MEQLGGREECIGRSYMKVLGWNDSRADSVSSTFGTPSYIFPYINFCSAILGRLHLFLIELKLDFCSPGMGLKYLFSNSDMLWVA
jgi:hypothetical protein